MQIPEVIIREDEETKEITIIFVTDTGEKILRISEEEIQEVEHDSYVK